jgi:lysophospholipase L1-like esterase
MASALVGLKSTLAKIFGEIETPTTIWLSDSQTSSICASPGDFNVEPGEQFVSIAGGKIEHAQLFLREREAELKTVENIVLHIGTNDICKLKGFGRQPLVTIDPVHGEPPNYFRPPPGYLQDPDATAPQVVARIGELVREAARLYPRAAIWTTDPTARRTKGGFANLRVGSVARTIQKQSPNHHHLTTFKRYIRHNNKKHKGNDGGRHPLAEEKFQEDGVHYSKVELLLFLNTIRTAIDELKQGPIETGKKFGPNYFTLRF